MPGIVCCRNGLYAVGCALIAWLMLSIMLTGSVNAADIQKNDFRLSFNKSGHWQTAWVHANPWWPPNKDRRESLGGPDVAMRRYPGGAAMWCEVAKELEVYGINGIQLESSVNAPYYNVFRAVFEGFQAAGNQRKVVFFLGMHGNNIVADTVKFFTTLQAELSHPNLYKLDGRPVIVMYSASGHARKSCKRCLRQWKRNSARWSG